MNVYEWLECRDPEELMNAIRTSDVTIHSRRNQPERDNAFRRWWRLLACSWWRAAHQPDPGEEMEVANNVEQHGYTQRVGSALRIDPHYMIRDCLLTFLQAFDHNTYPLGCSILRDIIRHPVQSTLLASGSQCHHPCQLDLGHEGEHQANWFRVEQAWRTPLTQDLAQMAFTHRQKDGTLESERLFVLADALEELGAHCDILGHLRLPQTHYPGCWAVDYFIWEQVDHLGG